MQILKWFALTVLTGISLGWLAPLSAHDSGVSERLTIIGPAPKFSLTTHDAGTLALRELRGKVVVVSFIYTNCTDTCPLLTAKLVSIQKQLGNKFGSKVYFVSLTVDPERDRPGVLRRYATTLGSDFTGWTYLTGTPSQVIDVARSYGVYQRKRSAGDVDHNLLTSIVDQQGNLRVQYMGDRFDPHEFLDDIRSLLAEDDTS